MTPYAVLTTGFALVLVAGLVVEVLARTGLTYWRTLGEAVHAGLRGRVGRWLVMLAWLWTGFHLLAR